MDEESVPIGGNSGACFSSSTPFIVEAGPSCVMEVDEMSAPAEVEWSNNFGPGVGAGEGDDAVCTGRL